MDKRLTDMARLGQLSIPCIKTEASLGWPSIRSRPKHIVNKCPVNALREQAYFPAHSPHRITGSRCKFPWWHEPWEVDGRNDIWNKVLRPKNAWLWLKIALAHQIRDNYVSLLPQPYLWVWQVNSDTINHPSHSQFYFHWLLIVSSVNSLFIMRVI